MRTLVGKILGLVGLICIPLAIGMVVGYLLSDRGIRLIPTTLELVLVILVAGLVLIPLGRIVRGTAFFESRESLRVRRRIWVATALASVVVLLRLAMFWMEAPSPLTKLSHEEFNTAYKIDLERFASLEKDLERTACFLESYDKALRADAGVLDAADEQMLLDAWNTANNASFGLDQLRVFYEDWYRYDPSRMERSYHLRAFLMSYLAELVLYEKSLRIVEAIQNNPNAQKYLDSPQPSLGLSEGSFSMYRQELQGAKDVARVLGGQQYLKVLGNGFDGRNEALGLGVNGLWEKAEETLEALGDKSTFKKAASSISADMQLLQRQVRRRWFPAQRSVAQWMGDTKLRRIGTYLVTAEQRVAADKHLEPGDILIARKNWYLSNVGLPGFWPHGMLYLGDSKKLKEYFDTPEIKDHILERSGGASRTLAEYLAAAWPQKWATYVLEQNEEPNRVIESVSEGVVFSRLQQVSGDYFAALRPRLNKLAKAQAIIAAFSHHGKPYDFNFDFATDHALVCTELVWRSYRPEEGKDGLRIPLVNVMGRKTLPANEIVRLYAEEHGKHDAQLEFVYFIDAQEDQRRTFVSSEEKFRQSHLRTKWDLQLP